MTASRSERAARAPWRLAALVLAPLVLACRAGLPPEPPGEDPADPAAAAAPYQVPPDPYASSAFAGAPAATASEHAGHGDMGAMDHSQMNHGARTGGPVPAPPEAPR